MTFSPVALFLLLVSAVICSVCEECISKFLSAVTAGDSAVVLAGVVVEVVAVVVIGEMRPYEGVFPCVRMCPYAGNPCEMGVGMGMKCAGVVGMYLAAVGVCVVVDVCVVADA